MSKYSRVGFFDTDRQVATVAIKTTQLILSQFENFLTYWIENEIKSLCAKKFWWMLWIDDYVILNVAVRFFFESQCSFWPVQITYSTFLRFIYDVFKETWHAMVWNKLDNAEIKCNIGLCVCNYALVKCTIGDCFLNDAV